MSAQCQRHDETLVELARGAVPLDAAARTAAVAHAAECAQCTARLESERRLSRALGALAAEDAGRGAPPGVERALLSALRTVPAPRGRPWRMAAALVAAALALAALDRWPSHGPELPAGAPSDAFLPIAWAEPLAPGEPGQLVTAAVDRTTLAALGVPATQGLSESDALVVDLVVGSDGVARAFRLARAAGLGEGDGGRP